MLVITVPQGLCISGMVSSDLTLEEACGAIVTLNPHVDRILPGFFNSEQYALVATCHNEKMLPDCAKPESDELINVPVVLDAHCTVGQIASLFNSGCFINVQCIRLPRNKSLTVVSGGMFSSLPMKVGPLLSREITDGPAGCNRIVSESDYAHDRKHLIPEPNNPVLHGVVVLIIRLLPMNLLVVLQNITNLI